MEAEDTIWGEVWEWAGVTRCVGTRKEVLLATCGCDRVCRYLRECCHVTGHAGTEGGCCHVTGHMWVRYCQRDTEHGGLGE